jgi:hypothetical protein
MACANEPRSYRRTVPLDIREVTRRLNHALGGTIVASLAGVKDLKLSYEWAREGGPPPGAEAVTRLLFAYEQWQLVSDAEDDAVARAWFIGANPWLEHDTPVNAIRHDRLRQVAAAAQALVDHSFNG